MRVDLENGLTIFPIHLKSNANGVCFDTRDAADLLDSLDLPPLPTLADIQSIGNQDKAAEDLLNSVKRERVIAAIKKVADTAVQQGRTVLLAGDFSPSFEPGKVGTAIADCQVQPFS